MRSKLWLYLEDRLKNPVSWLALSFIASWAAAAVFGVSPLGTINLICVVFSVVEWGGILLWQRNERKVRLATVEILPPAADRWKIAVLILVGVITVALDLWIASSSQSFLSIGVTVLGISSLITLWYAWSRPVLITESGLFVGMEAVRWSGIKRVLWNEAGVEGAARIDFIRPNYFYGAKLRVRLTSRQAEGLGQIMPATVRRENALAQAVT